MPCAVRGGVVGRPAYARRVTGCQFTSYNGLHTHADKMPGYARCVDASFQRATQRALRAADGAAAGRRTAATMMPVGVPRVPYKGKFRTWQWVDIWNCLYRDRIIFMSDALNDELGNQLVATMLYLDSENKKDISIYMNVEGGEVVPSLAMHDTFKHIKSDVATIGFGGVMGMAGFLLACGKPGKRYALPHTSIMLHHPSGTAQGQADDVHNEGRELLRLRDYMDATLSVATGRSFYQIQDDLERSLYMSSRDAIDYGVIDKVLKPRPKKMR